MERGLLTPKAETTNDEILIQKRSVSNDNDPSSSDIVVVFFPSRPTSFPESMSTDLNNSKLERID